jgi:hypothetical protein
LKGIIIIGFADDFSPRVDTQVPSNVCEFLDFSDKMLQKLKEEHLLNKMEPNFIHLKLDDGIQIASLYTGFSFRHYVGKPNYAISVFLSEDDVVTDDFEGMLRQIAHELLPKREALNFDDILGKYYEMLKSGELTPYWEDIIEGESSPVYRNEEKKSIDQDEVEDESNQEESTQADMIRQLNDVKAKNENLARNLEKKKAKIRELSTKYTELISEHNKIKEAKKEMESQLGDDEEKFKAWSQEMADLNEHNGILMDQIKDLNDKVEMLEEFVKSKEEELEKMKRKISDTEEIEEEAEKLLSNMNDLKQTNADLRSRLLKKAQDYQKLEQSIKTHENENRMHLDTITNLKLELKSVKQQHTTSENEHNALQNQIFDLKKEIKILRRERDHYMKIIQDNDLL